MNHGCGWIITAAPKSWAKTLFPPWWEWMHVWVSPLWGRDNLRPQSHSPPWLERSLVPLGTTCWPQNSVNKGFDKKKKRKIKKKSVCFGLGRLVPLRLMCNSLIHKLEICSFFFSYFYKENLTSFFFGLQVLSRVAWTKSYGFNKCEI